MNVAPCPFMATVPDALELSSPLAAFESRDVRVHAPARLLAATAYPLQSAAVGFQVHDLTHNPLALGDVGLAHFLPWSARHIATRLSMRASRAGRSEAMIPS
ncbi:hypothetical protein WMF18_03135 [Sorangium sp. So ce315]|uniref:hypothetical protein n=1 Tax=Sorangium sp. So ce315 TaxID=3133299 RepID=UPI003F63FCC6